MSINPGRLHNIPFTAALLLAAGLAGAQTPRSTPAQDEQALETSAQIEDQREESVLERRRLSSERRLEAELQAGDEAYEAQLESALQQRQQHAEQREEAELQPAPDQ